MGESDCGGGGKWLSAHGGGRGGDDHISGCYHRGRPYPPFSTPKAAGNGPNLKPIAYLVCNVLNIFYIYLIYIIFFKNRM